MDGYGASRDVREQFGPRAERYLTSHVHADTAALAEYLALVRPNGGLVLDIATGAGHTALAFAPHCAQVIASDVTPEMLAVTEQEAKRRGITNLQTAIADAEDLPFEARSFDGVTCRTAAHHFRDPRAFLAEVARVMRPSGWFLLVDTAGSDDPKANRELNEIEYRRDPSHVWDHSAGEWQGMLSAAGFEIRAQQTRLKQLLLDDWLDRMNVAEPTRSQLVDAIMNSAGELRAYLQPRDDGGTRTFRLHELVALCALAPA